MSKLTDNALIAFDDGTVGVKPIAHGEVFVNGESIGFYQHKQFAYHDLKDEEIYKEYQEVNWFWLKYIVNNECPIKRQWGNTKHIWCNRNELD